jgi:DNA-binding MarR family transcriptional regulator
MQTKSDPALVASELRVVLSQLVRRLRVENRFPLSHGAVLGRIDRDGPQSISDLACAERIRPQSMAQTVAELESDGLLRRHPDPADRRRSLIDLTEHGRVALTDDRQRRDGWLARTLTEELSGEEQAVLTQAVELLRRLAES